MRLVYRDTRTANLRFFSIYFSKGAWFVAYSLTFDAYI
ncbi:MAG: hypothetical protein ACJAVH_000251, partial [Bacteroidia bacterium]